MPVSSIIKNCTLFDIPLCVSGWEFVRFETISGISEGQKAKPQSFSILNRNN